MPEDALSTSCCHKRLAPKNFEDFINNLYAARLNDNIGEEATDTQAAFCGESLHNTNGTACKWQLLT